MKQKFRLMAWIGGLAALLVSACACSPETALQRVLGGSAEAPVFISCKAVSATEISFRFSLPVRVKSLVFDPPLEAELVSEGAQVRVRLHIPLEGGRKVTADMLVEDEHGNTLAVLVPFRTKNDRVPALLITEVRTEYAKPKAEFVELKTFSAGNLGAVRLFIAGAGMDTPVFEFPPVEVRAGEYIVIHLRNLHEGLDEIGENLEATPYTKDNEALAEARDFWVPGSKKLLRKTDAVMVIDQDDRILDGLLLSENPDPWWKDEKMVMAAEMLTAQGAWESAGAKVPGPADAVFSARTTTTRSICRDETGTDTGSSADWYITASSNATPGKVNSIKRYIPKE
ncbi:MAG: hypothetical protein LBD08_05430 [Treponema sp.]|jgi:hypothetical protein|nr:hypothetical protein [Treponema sp.]